MAAFYSPGLPGPPALQYGCRQRASSPPPPPTTSIYSLFDGLHCFLAAFLADARMDGAPRGRPLPPGVEYGAITSLMPPL